MKKRLSDTTVSLLIAVALHVVLIVSLIRFGSIKPEPLSRPKGVIRIEGAGGAIGGVGSPAFGALGAPYQAVAICAYSQLGEMIQLDTTTTPKNNPPFTKCPVTIPQISSARKSIAGVFKFSLKHRRVEGFSVIESTGNDTTDSAIVANILRQGFWTSDRHIQPERSAYIVKLGK